MPFLSSLAGVALTGFGLALISRDGVLEILSILMTSLLVWLGVANLL